MCEFELSPSEESRAQSADSWKACRKPRAFNLKKNIEVVCKMWIK